MVILPWTRSLLGSPAYKLTLSVQDQGARLINVALTGTVILQTHRGVMVCSYDLDT